MLCNIYVQYVCVCVCLCVCPLLTMGAQLDHLPRGPKVAACNCLIIYSLNSVCVSEHFNIDKTTIQPIFYRGDIHQHTVHPIQAH